MRPQQWLNAGPDEGAPTALLERVAASIAVPAIDEVWLFPARRTAGGESIVIVVSRFDTEAERRRLYTFRFTITRDRRGQARVDTSGDEHGSAPATAIPRVIEGVLRRLGDDAEVPPHGQVIGGDAARWDAWMAELRRAGEEL